MKLLSNEVTTPGAFVPIVPSGWHILSLTVEGTESDAAVTVAINKRTVGETSTRVVEDGTGTAIALTEATPEKLVYVKDLEELQAIQTLGTQPITVSVEKAQP